MNIMMDSTPINISVDAALRLSGGRNAGTPFETASTPVIAVHPFEKAVRSAKRGQQARGGRRVRQLARRRDRAREISPGAETEHPHDADDENMWAPQNSTGLAYPAQVADHDQRHESQPDLDAVRDPVGKAEVSGDACATLTATVST
jgi:hypothetical protein